MRATVAEPFGVVQVVNLLWDKSARGGQGTRDRNAVPLAFAVPAADLAEAGGHLCVAVSHCDDRNAFTAPFSARKQRVIVADGFVYGCVSVLPRPNGLQVSCQYNQAVGGAPDRWFLTAIFFGVSYITPRGPWLVML